MSEEAVKNGNESVSDNYWYSFEDEMIEELMSLGISYEEAYSFVYLEN